MGFGNLKLNSGGMKKMLTSAGVRSMLTTKAEAVLSAARSSAPVISGEYVNSLHIVQATTDRAVTRVAASAPHSAVVEADNGTLSRALDAAG